MSWVSGEADSIMEVLDIWEQVTKLVNMWKPKGVKLSMSTPGGNISLDKIVIDKDKRKQGLGKMVMKHIIALADSNNKTIVLSPSTDFGATSVVRLKKFYKQFGFVENKGKNKDFEISDSMYRLPKG